ncbi:iron uptake porin [Nostoc sphaeroides]|uniref:S-layer protein n=1 Tax=Nostoc sphaeroides CCNUC1 TaxID=2653204 RepID=A0A5P8WB20_9NOSO|nr:iron uptake porin [Nostoc sphaeroides]MCC5632075.1 iron uptake porin [Nostoc sphaeroides CHAB 2801]QFS49983.1 S-layer protein [Nostoc sphaeroides CCNUC1]
MFKVLWNYGLVIPVLFNVFFILSSAALAAEAPDLSELKSGVEGLSPSIATQPESNQTANLEVTKRPDYLLSQEPSLLSQETFTEQDDSLPQVNSVSELSDVQPTDWAFQAIQSLVERYGAIAGYADGTFKGNRALTRYEFAAGLNTALDRINQIIGSSTADLVRQEDLDTIKKLREEFSTELAALRGRIDAVDAKLGVIESQQFSPTVKLTGRVQFVLGSLFAGNNVITGQRAPRVVTLQDSVTLRLNASFTGKDSLGVTMGGGNIESLGQTRAGLLGTYDGRTADNANLTRPRNDLSIGGLRYRFPLDSKTQVNIYALSDGANELGFTVPINPYFESSLATGSNGISRFSRRALVYQYGDAGGGIAVLHRLNQQFQVGIAYSAPNANNPGANTGFFTGRYLALGQILYTSPEKNFRAALTYVNTYSPPNAVGLSGTNFGPAAGSNLVNSTVAGTGTVANLYGVQAFYQFSPKFAMNGWVSYGAHRYLGRGDGNAMDWAVGMSFPDLGKEGSLGGLFVGMAPKLTRLSSNVDLGAGLGQADKDLSLHIEGFYQYKITDKIDITPGFIWVTAPDSNANNPDSLFAWIRTVYRF